MNEVWAGGESRAAAYPHMISLSSAGRITVALIDLMFPRCFRPAEKLFPPLFEPDHGTAPQHRAGPGPGDRSVEARGGRLAGPPAATPSTSTSCRWASRRTCPAAPAPHSSTSSSPWTPRAARAPCGRIAWPAATPPPAPPAAASTPAPPPSATPARPWCAPCPAPSVLLSSGLLLRSGWATPSPAACAAETPAKPAYVTHHLQSMLTVSRTMQKAVHMASTCLSRTERVSFADTLCHHPAAS